jgi:hypothetical protein
MSIRARRGAAAGSSAGVDGARRDGECVLTRINHEPKTCFLNFSPWFGEKYGGKGANEGGKFLYCAYCASGWRSINDFSEDQKANPVYGKRFCKRVSAVLIRT